MQSLQENQLLKNNIKLSIQRLIAIWALSEAAMGGVLHAFKIPLTGIFINSSAVIIISLIAYFTDKKGTILQATLVVLLVKAAVSPHTPLNAYLAVSLQGLIGEIIFFNRKYFKISTLLFGIITLFLSGIQRIIVITILFGKNLWESIDLFGNYLLHQFPVFFNETENYEISYWLIVLYVGIHLLVGIMVGIFAGNTPRRLQNNNKAIYFNLNDKIDFKQSIKNKNRKTKLWLQKPSSIAVFLLVVIIVILTYVYPEFSESVAIKAILMVVRSILIMMIWYFFAGPFLLKIYKNYINKYGSKYTHDVNMTIQVLPVIKTIVSYSWKHSKRYNNINRIKYFIWTTLINILVLDFPKDEKNIPANRT